jgi:hypothetical protein
MPLLALALTALSVLALQVSLTRLFSLVIWYHFAFLAIAVALLGFTAGGVLVQLRPSLREGDLDARMSTLCLMAALTTVLALALTSRIPFGVSVLESPTQFGYFLAMLAAVTVPFVLTGTVVAAVLSSYGTSAPVLYAADLAGSGLGCALSVLALDHLGGGAGAMVASATALALAAMAFASRSEGARGRRLAVTGAVVVGLAVLTGWARDPLHGPFYLPNAKIYPRIPKGDIYARRCDSTACVDLFRNPSHMGVWGLSRRYDLPLPRQVGVVIDAWALTSIFEAPRRMDGSVEWRHPVFEMLLPSFVHLLDRARGFVPRRMLVIGAGGGVDVRAALHFNVPIVEGVEINRNILRGVSQDFDHFAGGLYHHPRVRIVHAEGRHYLHRSTARYDVLQVSGVDTYAASQAGAFALSENFLYTVEAFKEYLGHLSPDGTLTMTRWLYRPDRHTIRLCTIADRAYRELSLGDAAARMVILGGGVREGPGDLSLLLARRRPFRDEELRAIRVLAAANGFDVLWAPDGGPGQEPFTRYFRTTDRDVFVQGYHYRIEPTTDDTPFFFEYNRFTRLLSSREWVFGAASGQTLLVVTFLLALLGGAFVLLLPPWLKRRRGGLGRGGLFTVREASTFLALGLGYIAVESVFVPKFSLFLGHPVHALSVVLFALLLSSGLGSALAARWVGSNRRRLTGVALAVALLLVLESLGLPRVFEATLAWPFTARCALAVGFIALPGVFMGMPFPTSLALGVRARAEATRAPWAAWAWVLNGYASVVGSVGAMIVAMAWGFTVVLFMAALCYALVAWLAWGASSRASVEPCG